MTENRLRLIIFAAVFVVVLLVYLHSVAPTAAFWDCGEFIAASYVLGIPHPPGTPLFVAIGRLFSLLPVNPEIAYRINFIPVLFGALSCGLIYLIVVKLISLYRERDKYPWLKHVAGVFGGLMCAFAYSYWDNCVEAEVYAPSAVVALGVLYMAMLWRSKVEAGSGDNRLILLTVFVLFLATGIHFTPMMVVFAVVVFMLLVDKMSLVRLRLLEFFSGFLVILAVTAMAAGGAETVALRVVVAALMLGCAYFGVRMMERSERRFGVLWGLGLLLLMFAIGYLASSGAMMDNTVLLLASPTVAVIEMWVTARWLLVLFFVGYGLYLYWLHRQGRLDPKYVALMLGLLFLASSVQFIMFIRAKTDPPINEVDPSNWRDFVSVLRREQYDPMKLYPRKTMFLTENDYRLNQNQTVGLIVGYFEQVKFYLRYFFWQWGSERFFDIFRGLSWPALLGLVPPLLGLWGMWNQYRREKRSFVLIFVAFLVASVGLITYLNLKYSPSDPRPQLQFREVRERDYFYAFSFVFYTIFVGVGLYAFLQWMVERLRLRKALAFVLSGVTVAYGFVPMVLNYPQVTRRHNWIPAEYGYNMLISCPGEKAVVFTNGDNDTFPLWFMQTVPSRVSGLDPQFGKNVAVANLSLLNTNWYCKQLKRWGAPVSFSEEEIDRLPQGFVGKGNRTFLLKDVMMRDIVATSGGVKLTWPDDYGSTAAEFIAKVFGSGRWHPTTPVYFATTVSNDNLTDFQDHLRLEGLVNRVVPERGANMVDVEATHRYLFEVYRTTSMLDPRVARDENTRGMLINYAASFLALANEYQRMGRPGDAQEVLTRALDFDLDEQRRIPLFYHLSIFATLNGDYENALSYIDSIQAAGYDDPELAIRKGFAYQAMGDYGRAEEAYLAALAASPNQPNPVQALYKLYVEDMFDTVKARKLIEDWLKRVPGDSIAQTWLKQIS